MSAPPHPEAGGGDKKGEHEGGGPGAHERSQGQGQRPEGEAAAPAPEPAALPEVDLTSEEPGQVTGAVDLTHEDVGGDINLPIELGRKRESVRGRLAAALLGLLGVIVIGSGVIAAAGWMTVDDLKSLLDILLPPVVALAGTAIGFYFGGQTTSSAPPAPANRPDGT